MKKIYILYRSFFDMKGDDYTVGGIQTYIRALTNVIQKQNAIPVIVQFADISFHKKYHNIDVHGIDVHKISSERKKAKVLLEYIKPKFKKDDILIFATEDLFMPTFTDRVVAIQHGITWDIPKQRYNNFILELLRKSFSSYRHLIRTKKLSNLVCVDYNYINWIRTQLLFVDKNIYAIPNSTIVKADKITKDNSKINIIFARRFEVYRGTKLFANVINEILNNYNNVYVTFAGTGRDEAFLKNLFENNYRVSFITYHSEESLDIHEKHHIAVIPTLGSEGTSLSLLEAMASQCAVIGTNVGGITNILIDNYNGLIINPEESKLYEAIEKLIINKELRENLSRNAYDTVAQGFNYTLWEDRWKKVLEEI